MKEFAVADYRQYTFSLRDTEMFVAGSSIWPVDKKNSLALPVLNWTTIRPDTPK